MRELVLTRAQVRELDRRASEEFGVPSIVLMENAGRACAREALALVAGRPGAASDPGPDPGAIVVCAGPGNNGGDGFVVARTLVNHGCPARVFFLGAAERLERGSADALTNARAWRAMGGRTELLGEGEAGAERWLEELRAALRATPLAVDALFGTGLTRPLEGRARAAVEALALASRVLAVDLPSGLDADTGEVLGAAARAEATVTFVGAKAGLRRAAGPALAGRVVVAEIGIPRPLLEEAAGGAPAHARGR